MLGQRIGPYQLVRQIGSGGMGKVYEAVHEQLGRRAAIKVLHAHLIADSQLTARFLNEGRAASRVDHPGIVQVLELGVLDGGAPFTVMEFLRGESLQRRIDAAAGPLPVALCLRVVRQVGDALVAAHAAGIVHRDLKPDNVMIVPDPAAEGGERTKLLDFGIAKLTEGLTDEHLRTQTGAILGTPLYMAPEQCRGAGRASDRTDVYAVGVMLYQMLAGRPPFGGTSLGDLILAHLAGSPVPLREQNPAVPDGLASLVHRMLAKAPEERPAMSEVVASVDAVMRGEEVGASLANRPFAGGAQTSAGGSRGRRALIAVAALVLVAGIVGSALVTRSEPEVPAKAVPAEPAPEPEPEALPGGSGLPESFRPPPAIADALPRAPAPPGAARERPAAPEKPAAPADRDPPRESPRAEPAMPFRVKQTWSGDFLGGHGRGTRVCEDDRTDLTVTISRIKGRRVDAVFEFSSHSGHAGSYHISGTYQPSGRRIAFRPGRWIELDVHDNDRSEDFTAVGMDGRVDADGETFSGRLTSAPCETFHLHPR